MNESYDDARGMLGDLSVAASLARQAIDPRGHRLLRVWGFVYLVGFGALWADITFRDGPSPVLGLACLGVAGLVGLASTTRELQRLHGLSGASQRAVRRLWMSWALTLVAWGLLFGLHVSLHPGRPAAATTATASALAVVLTGAWLMANPVQVLQSRIGLSLVIAGLIGLQIPSGGYAMLFLWVTISLALFVGSVIAKPAPAQPAGASHRD